MDNSGYQPRREPTKTCFLPTCPHDNFQNPGMRFFSIRKELKESWCIIVGRNCPKRPLFSCEDHINLEEDLENYEKWTSGAKPRLKLNATPKNIPKRTDNLRTKALANKYSKLPKKSVIKCKESTLQTEIEFETHRRSRDVGVQCKPVMRDVAAYGKPAVKSVGYLTNDEEMLPRKPSQCACIQSLPCMSLSFTTSSKDAAMPPPSCAAISKENTDYERNVSDWQDILRLIEKKADSYIGVSKCSLMQTVLPVKEEIDTEIDSISAVVKMEYEEDGQTESTTENHGTADSRPENLELETSIKSELGTEEESSTVTYEQFLKGCELYLTPELRDYVKNQVKHPI